MSVARGFGLNGKSYYTNVAKPTDVNLNFVVDSTNGNGLGIRSLKSNGYVQNVFMNTSATPASNNPNPAAGFALIQMKNNFNAYLGGFSGFVSPVGVTSSSTSTHSAYTITRVGTTTLAQWNTAGLPAGLTPTVGQSFVATASGALGGTGLVSPPLISGITSVEVVGDPNQSISNSNLAQNAGAWLLVQFLAPTNTSTTTLIPTAPANNSTIGMTVKYDASSVTVDGL